MGDAGPLACHCPFPKNSCQSQDRKVSSSHHCEGVTPCISTVVRRVLTCLSCGPAIVRCENHEGPFEQIETHEKKYNHLGGR